jgi:hypothetical protein
MVVGSPTGDVRREVAVDQVGKTVSALAVEAIFFKGALAARQAAERMQGRAASPMSSATVFFGLARRVPAMVVTAVTAGTTMVSTISMMGDEIMGITTTTLVVLLFRIIMLL